ncbi:MAG TPA: hypothetical protein VJ813_17005 [Vicinamibacterales bacterium]|nr:hypothetical protein [Vicinamibacterales bacterium]
MKRLFLVPALGALALAVAAPASAQWGWPDSRQSRGYSSEVRRVAYDRGFREGVTEGEKDGRSRDPFRYQDERDFQRGDVGYNRSYGDVERYRQTFRQGFADGYAEGYRRFSSRYGNNGRYAPNDRRGYGYPQGRNDRYFSPFDIGARDGYEKGREDARDNDRFDPRRHKWYRDGDRDYDNRYGSRERYKDEYRRGFTVGYERGYRERR